MTKANIIKIVGTIVAVISAGVGVKFPQYATYAMSVSTFILGALHVKQPGQS